MSKPTESQIKEVWEWCGFSIGEHPEPKLKPNEKAWYDPDGNFYAGLPCGLPPIDLNNLFKYAVPKLTKEYIELEIHFDYLVKSDSWNVALLDGFYNHDEPKYLISVVNSKDPALALFWAIWEVIHNE